MSDELLNSGNQCSRKIGTSRNTLRLDNRKRSGLWTKNISFHLTIIVYNNFVLYACALRSLAVCVICYANQQFCSMWKRKNGNWEKQRTNKHQTKKKEETIEFFPQINVCRRNLIKLIIPNHNQTCRTVFYAFISLILIDQQLIANIHYAYPATRRTMYTIYNESGYHYFNNSFIKFIGEWKWDWFLVSFFIFTCSFYYKFCGF